MTNEETSDQPEGTPESDSEWVYEPHTASARAHRVTNRRDDSLSFYAGNRNSGIAAAATLSRYAALVGAFNAVVAGELMADDEAQGAYYLRDWLEGLRTTMLQGREALMDAMEKDVDSPDSETDAGTALNAFIGTLAEIDRLIGPVVTIGTDPAPQKLVDGSATIRTGTGTAADTAHTHTAPDTTPPAAQP